MTCPVSIIVMVDPNVNPNAKEDEEQAEWDRYVAQMLFEHQLREAYKTMNGHETWINKHSIPLANQTTGNLSPLLRMNGSLYDGYIADPWFGYRPHPQMPPYKETQRAPFVLGFVREPAEEFDKIWSPEDDYLTDTLFLKHLHQLAKVYKGTFNFGWVDVVKDEYNIAFSLGIDLLDPAFFPCLVLVNGDSMYMAPQRVTHSYHNIAQFIEGTYQEDALTIWPLQRRLSSIGYLFKSVYRRITRSMVSFYTHSDLLSLENEELELGERDPVTWQEAKLAYGGAYLIKIHQERIDHRETTFKYIARHLSTSSDDYEAIAFVLSPICLIYLLRKYCGSSQSATNIQVDDAQDKQGMLKGKAGKSEAKDKQVVESEVKQMDQHPSGVSDADIWEALKASGAELVARDRLTKELEKELLDTKKNYLKASLA